MSFTPIERILECLFSPSSSTLKVVFPFPHYFAYALFQFLSFQSIRFPCESIDMVRAVVVAAGGALFSASLQVLFDWMTSRDVLTFLRGQKLSDTLLKNLKMKFWQLREC